LYLIYIYIYILPMPPHVLMNFRGFPPGCGDSVPMMWVVICRKMKYQEGP